MQINDFSSRVFKEASIKKLCITFCVNTGVSVNVYRVNRRYLNLLPKIVQIFKAIVGLI